jgi:hypothetical protein
LDQEDHAGHGQNDQGQPGSVQVGIEKNSQTYQYERNPRKTDYGSVGIIDEFEIVQ